MNFLAQAIQQSKKMVNIYRMQTHTEKIQYKFQIMSSHSWQAAQTFRELSEPGLRLVEGDRYFVFVFVKIYSVPDSWQLSDG